MVFTTMGKKINRTSLWVALFLLLAGPGLAQKNSKPLTIGIAADDPTLSEHVEWFKTSLAEFGYIEGKNINYISYGFVENAGKIDNPQTQEVLSGKPDLIFALGNYSASWAQKATEGTGIPAIFSMISSDPVGEGFVESLGRPQGNMTGIRVPNSVPKALEWLVATVPGTKKIFLPYDPSDEISVLAMDGLCEAASQLGVELVALKISSAEEAVAAIETLPEDIDAIFRIPSRTFELSDVGLSRAAMERNLPVGSANDLDEEVLVTFSPDFKMAGKQAARLADKILRGANPSDLPIESAEIRLTIDLKVAEKIHIHVPDDVLVNANTIVR